MLHAQLPPLAADLVFIWSPPLGLASDHGVRWVAALSLMIALQEGPL